MAALKDECGGDARALYGLYCRDATGSLRPATDADAVTLASLLSPEAVLAVRGPPQPPSGCGLLCPVVAFTDARR